MIAYKGFKGDLTCTMGKGSYQYQPGVTFEEDSSKCARTGLHCTENPLDVLHYYGLNQGNRFFQVIAEGDIHEDGVDTRIACTRMTLVEELSVYKLLGHAMMYMVNHPQREWKQSLTLCQVAEDRAEVNCTGAIAVARGKDPVVRAAAGGYVGLIREPQPGQVEAARMCIAGHLIKADTWYHITAAGEWEEVAGDEI